MAKELLLYSPIYDFTAELLISSIEEAKGNDVVIRMNTPGGSVYSGWGIIAKMQEHDSKIDIKVDGAAMSMGAVMLCFADTVEVLDVSRIMLHRADMYAPTPEDQKFLDGINKDIKAKLKSKIDNEKLKSLPSNINKVGIDELFSSPDRIDLYITGKEAKQIGLANKVITLTPVEATAFYEKMQSLAAQDTNIKIPVSNNKKTMTLQEFRAQHPAIYNEAFEAGLSAGVTQERDRVGSLIAYVDVDPAGVAKHINDGTELTRTLAAELNRKAYSVDTLKALGSEAPEAAATATKEIEKPLEAKAKSIEDFKADVAKELGLK